MAREDKNGGEESLADHAGCPTRHLSLSAGKASLSKTPEVCRVTRDTRCGHAARMLTNTSLQRLICFHPPSRYNYLASPPPIPPDCFIHVKNTKTHKILGGKN